ncbi:MAG: dnaX, partial [Phycisphaerales bacterium]|nr:dnaX [Phycisphaerales bacterium]
RYDFRNIPTREIAGHLKSICEQEKIAADDAAILLVAKSGAGSMRDALSLLDRLLSAVGQNLTVESIEQLLGLPRSGQIFDLAAAIAAGDVKTTLERTDVLITSGLSPETLAGALIDHLRNLLILRTCGRDSDLVEVPGLSLDDLFAQAKPFDPVVLSQDIVVLEELRRQLRTSAAGRALVDATMVRLALADQFSTVETLLHAVDDGAPIGTVGGAVKKKSELNAAAPSREAMTQATPEPLLAASPRAESSPAPAPSEPSSEASLSASDEDDVALPAVGRVWDGAGPTSVFAAFKKSNAARPAAAPAPQAARQASNVEPVSDTGNNLGQLMARLRAAASEQQPTIAGFLEGGRIKDMEGGTVTLEYPRHLEMSAKMLDRNGKRENLQNVLAGLLGHTVGVRFTVNDNEPAPPLNAKSAEAQQANWRPPTAPTSAPEALQPAAASAATGIQLTEELRVELLQQNPLIKTLAEKFNARVVKVEESTVE